VTNTRYTLIAAAALLTSVLTACSSPAPTQTVTAAPLPAVTMTAAPVAGDALTSLDAWTVCYSFLTRYASRSDTGFIIPQLRSYDPQWVTTTPQGFQVQISPANLPGDWTCTVTGTRGAPQIVSWSTDN
jgi:hypothetical protein